MVKQIIKEAMDQNPLGLKEAVEAELRARVALALEAKMEESVELDEAKSTEEQIADLEAMLKKYTGSTPQIKMKRNAWEKKLASLKSMKEALDPVGKEDDDVDNDGDTDSSDRYLKKRRTAISKAIKKTGGLEEAKMTDMEVLRAARRLASVGKDEKTKEFGRGLLAFHTANGSFTPAQVSGLQNIMKNAPFQMAEAVVGAGPAFFDDGSHTTISSEDAAAINKMFASKSAEEQKAARTKMKASKSYYNSILAKARKG